jgi:2-oxoacid:acceptor oxidoreductase gamma subunit (pyruvate/2-ketoisovalerate family)
MFDSGYTGAAMIPTFGTERRGAPVFTSLKLSRTKVYDLSPTTRPDIVVVLDHLLLEEVDVAAGLKPGGLIVINSPRTPDAYSFGGMRVAVAAVPSLSVPAGRPQGRVTRGIIGTFGRAAGIIDIDRLLSAIREEFAGRKPGANAAAARLCFENTLIGGDR